LVGTESIATMQKFLRLVEPLSAEDRFHEPNAPNALTPLVTLADIAVPDTLHSREVTKMVNGLLGDAPHYSIFREDLEREFAEWTALPSGLAVVETQAPLVRDANTSARILAELGTAGLEALSFLSQAKQPSNEWVHSRLALLHDAARPHGGLRIAVEPALRNLLSAVADTTSKN